MIKKELAGGRKIRRGGLRLLAVVFSLSLILAAASAQAADLYIDGGSTYTVTGNLTYGNEYVGYNSSGVMNQSGFTNTLSGNLIISYNPGSSGTYNLSGGSLSASVAEIIGGCGAGTFNQSGGSNQTEFLTLGTNSGSNGTFNLSGGSFSSRSEDIGYRGVGTFNQSGGSNQADFQTLGGLSGSSGTYNLSGGSNQTIFLELGDSPGAMGTFNQSGGSNRANRLEVGWSGSGIYNLSGGSLSADSQYIGTLGVGTLNQSGGSNNANQIIFGSYSGSSGIYNLSGGSLMAVYQVIGYEGVGTFNQSGGSNQTDYLIFSYAGGAGAYSLSGGSLSAGTVYLNAGSVFSFTGGSFNSTILNNAGTLYIGPNCMVNVGSTYTQASGGNLLLGLASPASYGRISVAGSAGLSGTLTPVVLGSRPQGNQVYAGVLTAAGGLTGTFSLANPWISPTLLWQQRYSPTSVDLLVRRDYTSPALSLTGNQAAVGRMLNGVANTNSGDLNTVLNALDSLPDAGAVAQAYQQLSPDKAAALPILAFSGANLQKRTLSRRITDLRFGPGHTGNAGSLGAFNLGYTQGQGLMLASNSTSLAGLLTGSRLAGAADNPWGLYLDPALILGSQAASMNQTGFNYTIAGFNSGLDYRVADNLLVGLASGYSHTGAAFHGSGGAVEANTWPLTAYAAYLPQSFYAYGSLGYALNLFTLNRTINFSGLNRTATSAPAGNMFNAYGETGYDLKVKGLVLTPALSLAYSRLWLDGFTESGAGALNLQVAPQDAQSLQTGVGGKIAIPIQRGSTTVVPQIYAFYQHEFSQNSTTLDARLSQAGSTFPYQTAAPQRNFAVLGANFTLAARSNVKIQLDYNAEVGRTNSTAHYVSGGLRYEF
jgi:uncharacterized protein with beta-barrel porin domain